MPKTLLALSATMSIAASLVGQTIVVPAGATNADLSTSQNIYREVPLRYMGIYDSSNFTSQGTGQPIVINSISWRLASGLIGTANTYPSVEIYIENSATDYLTPSTTYQTNRTQARPRTPEYSGPVTLNVGAGTTPNSYSINVTLQNTFTYSPEAGQDLLIELVILAAPTTVAINTISCSNNPATQLCNAIRTVGNTVNTTGSQSNFCPTVRLGYTNVPGAATNQSYGTGCYERAASFYEQFAGSTIDLGGSTVTMTQNGNGGYNVATTPGATLVLPSGAGLALTDDVVTPTPINLPFTFQYPGGSTTQIVVDSNGSVLLNGSAASTFGNANSAAFLGAARHKLCPAMQDFLPDGATNVANVFAEPDPANPTTVFLITWLNVPCFGATPPVPSTFQVALIDNGSNDTCEFRYQSVVNNSTSNGGTAVTGFTRGGGVPNPGSSDLTAGPLSTTTDTFALQLTVAGRPVIGQPSTFTTSNIPATAAFSIQIVSSGQFSPGLDLTPLAPGCLLSVVLPEIQITVQVGSPTAANVLNIPPVPQFVGFTFYTQAASFVAGVNPFGLLTSTSVASTIGSL